MSGLRWNNLWVVVTRAEFCHVLPQHPIHLGYCCNTKQGSFATSTALEAVAKIICITSYFAPKHHCHGRTRRTRDPFPIFTSYLSRYHLHQGSKKKKRCKIAPPHAHHVMIRGDFTQMSQENKSSGLTMTIGTEFTGEARMHLKAASDKPVLQLCSSFGLGY